jgi:hypothetical protein
MVVNTKVVNYLICHEQSVNATMIMSSILCVELALYIFYLLQHMQLNGTSVCTQKSLCRCPVTTP